MPYTRARLPKRPWHQRQSSVALGPLGATRLITCADQGMPYGLPCPQRISLPWKASGHACRVLVKSGVAGFNMVPGRPNLDPRNDSLTYSVHCCQNSLAYSFGRSDGQNVFLSKFSVWVMNATAVSSMVLAVCLILLGSAPLKIVELAVGLITIGEVPTLHPCWALTNKRLKNKLVNFPRAPGRAKRDNQSSSGINGGSQLLPRFAHDGLAAIHPSQANLNPAAPHRAIAASLVAREVRHVAVFDGRIKLRHDTSLHDGLCLGLPFGCTQAATRSL